MKKKKKKLTGIHFSAAPQSSFFFEPLWHFVDAQHNPSLEVKSELSIGNFMMILMFVSFGLMFDCFRRSVPSCSIFSSATSMIPMSGAYSDLTSKVNPLNQKSLNCLNLQELLILSLILILSKFCSWAFTIMKN